MQKTQFLPCKEIRNDNPTDAITNRGKFSTAWWAKYFGLYACHNGKRWVSDMYFCHKGVVVSPPELRDANSRALDILDTRLCHRMEVHLKKSFFHCSHYS